jgi:uncharacterized protein YqjF (DUF2071 family)
MQRHSTGSPSFLYPDFVFESSYQTTADITSFNWPVLKTQLASQWPDITDRELEFAGQSRRRIATLIESKYHIPAALVENYLRNFEHTIHRRLGLTGKR